MKTLIVNRASTSLVIAILLLAVACGETEVNTGKPGGNTGGNNNQGGSARWTIPQNEVFDGGPGKDGIPALENPKLIPAGAATYLENNDLILGYKNGNEVRAYPHPILDWHEIINDKVDDHAFAITYCPLTGTGIGWDRIIDGQETTFGVSGLLYNTNLLPYDRLTDSNWSQMKLECVNGQLIGTSGETFHLIETTWATWKAMYPQTQVVSTETGFSRNYARYPYGDYKTNDANFLFPFSPSDNRIPAKERVYGILVDGKAKAYRFGSLTGDPGVREDVFLGMEVVIVGSVKSNIITTFSRELEDGTLLTFSAKQWDGSISEIIMTDNEGNSWNIFGEAVEGPRTGQKLISVKGFVGYWFSWAAFYPGLEVFGMQ